MERMKRKLIAFTVGIAAALLLSPYPLQAASPSASSEKVSNASTPTRVSASVLPASTAGNPKIGGIYKVLMKSQSDAFGYPPRIVGGDRDFAPPFFDHLLSVGDDGKYKPGLALSWDSSKDGKTITFKLRQGVTFHDGTPFNAQAVKANIDNLIPPKSTILTGISSVDAVDDYTVKLNLPTYNNLILYQFANNLATYMYSPEALKKNGEDWAKTHPVGTGPFILKDYQPNTSLTLAKHPNYWQKGLPYLDGLEMILVVDSMTQMITLKSGQANAIYSAQNEAAARLRNDGYNLMIATGSLVAINFDTKNSPIFSKRQVREAMEYAIDKETICSGPGEGLFAPAYQLRPSNSPDYNKACPPRTYNPVKAKKLLAEAGYPDGFSFKAFLMDQTWKDGWVAVQSYLDKVGIKMEINYLNTSGYNLIRVGGNIERGAAAQQTYPCSSNTLLTLDTYWHTPLTNYKYRVLPEGIDKLIDKAKLSRNSSEITKINQQIAKMIYDDSTIVPLWESFRLAVIDKSVQNSGWFVYGDPDNNEMGTRTWLKK